MQERRGATGIFPLISGSDDLNAEEYPPLFLPGEESFVLLPLLTFFFSAFSPFRCFFLVVLSPDLHLYTC